MPDGCPHPSHPQLAVSAAIFRDGKSCWCGAPERRPRVCIRCQAAGSNSANRCMPPLHREVAEETGAENRNRRPRRMARGAAGNAGNGHYLIMSFAARWIAGEPVLNDELDDFRWLAPDALGDLKLPVACTESSSRPGGCRAPGLDCGRPRLASSALKRHITGDPGPFMSKQFSGRSRGSSGVRFWSRAGPGRGRAVRRRPAAAGRNPRHAALSAGHLRQPTKARNGAMKCRR